MVLVSERVRGSGGRWKTVATSNPSTLNKLPCGWIAAGNRTRRHVPARSMFARNARSVPRAAYRMSVRHMFVAQPAAQRRRENGRSAALEQGTSCTRARHDTSIRRGALSRALWSRVRPSTTLRPGVVKKMSASMSSLGSVSVEGGQTHVQTQRAVRSQRSHQQWPAFAGRSVEYEERDQWRTNMDIPRQIRQCQAG